MSDGGWAPEDTAIADPATGTIRVCKMLCTTCIYRPGNLMHLESGRVQQMTRDAVADESRITCHKTIGTPEPAICAGFARHPLGKARSLALRFIRAGVARVKWIIPPGSKETEKDS